MFAAAQQADIFSFENATGVLTLFSNASMY